jgi:hypothetical protein
MKKASLIFLLFLMVSAAYTQDKSHQNISQAVLNSLPEWLSSIPAGDETSYGFQNREEFSRAGLGAPIEIFSLAEDAFTQTGKATMLVPIGEWRIPVIVDHKIRALVTVVSQAGEWRIVMFGASTLAREFNEVEKQLTAEQFARLKLVRIYQPLSNFLFYDDPATNPDQLILLPLRSASIYLERQGSPAKKAFTLTEVIKTAHESYSTQNQEQQ